jgi:cytochrome c-type biogenesis protein CcmE
MHKNLRRGISLGVVVIAAGVGLMSLVTGGGVTPYVGFDEARASRGNVQVMGDIISGQSSYEVQGGSFSFYISDANGDRMRVVYSGTKPGNFDQATSVVCVGRYVNDTFHADKLLVKCPSKYQNAPKKAGA